MKTNTHISVRYAHPSQAALDSIVTLRSYSAGRADASAALMALRRLEHIYGHPVKGAVSLFGRSLRVTDASVQRELRFEALCQITDWVFRNRIKASLWEQTLKISRSFKSKIAVLPPRLDAGGGYAACIPAAG